jgi:hypothetical protein
MFALIFCILVLNAKVRKFWIMGVFESMSYFLAHSFLAQIAQIATK